VPLSVIDLSYTCVSVQRVIHPTYLLNFPEIQTEALPQPVRIVPHAAEHGGLHDLFLPEVLLHRREGGIVVARREQRDGLAQRIAAFCRSSRSGERM
jgi:hypothetical protein